jgi:hypothetical protein
MTAPRSATSNDPRPTEADGLVERYVWAVTRRLATGQRDDVAAELRASIWDSIEDRTAPGDRGAGEDVVRAVLTELGDPERLAGEYSAAPRHLIGPAVYDDWRRSIRALLVAVPPIVTLVVIATALWTDSDARPAAIVVDGVWSGFQTALQILFWVTLAFWIVERTGTSLGRPEWDPDQLPEPPRERAIGVDELVWGVGIAVVGLFWLAWQQLRSPIERDGERVPMLNPDLWSGWLPVLAVLLVAIAVLAVASYAVGRWTLRVTVASIVLDLTLFAYFVALSLSTEVANPALFSGDYPELGVEGTLVVSAAVITVWGIVDAVRGHRAECRADRSTP